MIYLNPPMPESWPVGRITTRDGNAIDPDSRGAAYAMATYASSFVAAYNELLRLFSVAESRGLRENELVLFAGKMLDTRRNAGISLQLAGHWYLHFGMPVTDRPDGATHLGGVFDLDRQEWVDRWDQPTDWVRAGERMVTEVDAVLPNADASANRTGAPGGGTSGMGLIPLLGPVVVWFSGLPVLAQVTLAGLTIVGAGVAVYGVYRYTVDAVSAWLGKDLRALPRTLEILDHMLDECSELENEEERNRCFDRVLEGIDKAQIEAGKSSIGGLLFLGGILVAAVAVVKAKRS